MNKKQNTNKPIGEVDNTETVNAPAVDQQRLVRFSVDDLKAFAGARCRDIYNDFTEEEAKQQPRSVFLAWEVGRDICQHFEANVRVQRSAADKKD